MKLSASPSWDYLLCSSGAEIFEAAGFAVLYSIEPERFRREGFFAQPGRGRIFEAYSFTACGALKPPPPPGSSFSSGRKGCKRPFRGSLWTPPKDPRLILPISALYQVRASRPSLRRLVRANCARSSAALWNFVPTLGLSGSSGSEMPSHFRKSARLRRAQRAALRAALSGNHRGEH